MMLTKATVLRSAVQQRSAVLRSAKAVAAPQLRRSVAAAAGADGHTLNVSKAVDKEHEGEMGAV